MDMIPQASHSIRLRPTLPDPSATPAGDTNIPEPVEEFDNLSYYMYVMAIGYHHSMLYYRALL